MTARHIVLTGATRGLGRAMVDALVARGHVVHGCGRAKLHVTELKELYPAPHSFHAVDVTDEAAVMAWAKDVIGKVGPPDLLLNNAAVINTGAPLWKVSGEEFDRLIAINIGGVARVIRAFVPAMVKRGSGAIVNFSSGWGRSTSPEVAPYCASKYAIEGLTLALAQELPRGMAAVPLNPGIIDTDMLRTSFGGAAAGYPSPEVWAARVVPFLLDLGPRQNGESLTAPG